MKIEYVDLDHVSGWVYSKALIRLPSDQKDDVPFLTEDRLHVVSRFQMDTEQGDLLTVGDKVCDYVNVEPYRLLNYIATSYWREVGPFDFEKDIWDTAGY